MGWVGVLTWDGMRPWGCCHCWNHPHLAKVVLRTAPSSMQSMINYRVSH